MSTNQDDAQGEHAPSSSFSHSSVNLPPISTIYNFSASTSVVPNFPPPLTPHLPPPASIPTTEAIPPSNVSFNTYITPANTAELAEDDDADYDDDTNFVYEYGRRYHANADGRGLYPLPNDESEQERDDMKHKLALWMMHEKLFYAPVEDRLTVGGNVFDLGELVLFQSISSFSLLLPPPLSCLFILVTARSCPFKQLASAVI